MLSQLNTLPVQQNRRDRRFSRCGRAGWRAEVCDGPDMPVSPGEWLDWAVEGKLEIRETDKVLRKSSRSQVFIRQIKTDDGSCDVVIKRQLRSGILSAAKGLMRSGAKNNFRLGWQLLSKNIATAVPVAALYRMSGPFVVENILVTEYQAESMDLHHYVLQMDKLGSADAAVKHQLCRKTGKLLGGLHRAGFWHRDAKAGNFVVCPGENGVEVKLIDLDGIKRNWLDLRGVKMRGLYKLGSTLAGCGWLGASDYLRGLTEYDKLVGLSRGQRKRLFRNLFRKAVGLRLITTVRGLTNQRSA
mgnify:CR=1 FL=1